MRINVPHVLSGRTVRSEECICRNTTRPISQCGHSDGQVITGTTRIAEVTMKALHGNPE